MKCSIVSVLVPLLIWQSAAGDEPRLEPVSTALRRAVQFYSTEVAAHGGYVYRYSADLQKREGEGKVGRDTVWVQPPGTPAVGLAYLDAYRDVGESYLLDAARAAGECLIRGQLHSGGWTNSIELAAQARARHQYRVDPPNKQGRNWTTFDDDKTQSAMRMLMRLDRALSFQDPSVHEAITFALDSVLQAQFPNGAWPQGFREFPDPAMYPVKPAAYPDRWPRKYPGGDYWQFYTFNDNAIADTIDMLFLAGDTYDEPRYRQAAVRGGEFILLAQMPEPQPAWAQQYDFDMHPVWARKFEPPAISGGESQGIIEALMQLFERTGDRRFLEPVPRALGYLQRSEIVPGRLARFYELRSNKPLYFTRKYELTYDDNDLPTHYGFQLGSRVARLRQRYEQLEKLSADQLAARGRPRESSLSSGQLRDLTEQVHEVVEALDERGAWVEDGRLRYHGNNDPTRRIIDSATFIRHIDVLSRYIGAIRKLDE